MEAKMSNKALVNEVVGICRLCATVKRTNSLLTIQDKNDDICKKLIKCFHIKIVMNDSLPKCVCFECVQSLNQSFDFYKKVNESQESLAALFPPETEVCKAENLESIKFSNLNSPDSMEQHEGQCQVSTLSNPTKHSNQVDDTFEDTKSECLVDIISDDENKVEEILEPEESYDMDELETEIEFFSDDTEKEIDCNNYTKEELIVEKVDKDENFVKAHDNTWEDYNWECTVCKTNLSNVPELISHSLTEHHVDPAAVSFVCVDCQKTFPRYFSFLNHVRHHHRQKLVLLCDVCNERCSNFEQLAEHRSECHNSNSCYPSIVMCPVCGKSFWNLSCLNIHSKTHLPDQLKYRSKCHVCGNKYRNSTSLKMHMKVHLGIKEHVCDQCGKNFGQKINLDDHMLTHVTDSPYKCNVCQKSFKTSGRLAKHCTLHIGGKPYKCDSCDKDFRTKDALISHSRIHTGEMPYKCSYCDRHFRFRSILMTHLNIHTGARPYSCIDCHHQFTNWPNYNKHMKRRHGITATKALEMQKSFSAAADTTVLLAEEKSTKVSSSIPRTLSKEKHQLPALDSFQHKEDDVIEIIYGSDCDDGDIDEGQGSETSA